MSMVCLVIGMPSGKATVWSKSSRTSRRRSLSSQTLVLKVSGRRQAQVVSSVNKDTANKFWQFWWNPPGNEKMFYDRKWNELSYWTTPGSPYVFQYVFFQLVPNEYEPDINFPAGIYGGFLLGVRSVNGLAFYDWENTELIRRIEIQPKHVSTAIEGAASLSEYRWVQECPSMYKCLSWSMFVFPPSTVLVEMVIWHNCIIVMKSGL